MPLRALFTSGSQTPALLRGAQAEDEEGAGEEEDGGGGEGDLRIEGAPEKADEEAGDEVADGVHGGEGAEGHAVLFLGDQFGGKGVFEGFFGADIQTGQDEDHGEQPQGTRSGAKKECGDSSEGVASGEDGFAAGDVITEPAAQVGRAGVEDVVERVEADGEACGAG